MSWSNPKHKLRVTILVIYKESPQATTKNAGRGATKKHTAALEKLVAQQKGTGTGAVWQDVYRLFTYNSQNVCTNYGFYYWIHNGLHRKLDDKVLELLVDCVEEGVELKSHADMPERIREMIMTREKEDIQRKKRKATGPLPDHCCNHLPPASPDKGHARGVELNLPMRIDEALEPYSDWPGEKVANEEWRASYRTAAVVAIQNGYDLQWFCNNRISPPKGTRIAVAVEDGAPRATIPIHRNAVSVSWASCSSSR